MAHKNIQTVSSTHVQNNFGTFVAQIIKTSQPVFVEKHKHPVLVMISYEMWQNLSTQTPTESAWIKKVRQFTAEVKKKFPKQTPAVDLIRAIREEE